MDKNGGFGTVWARLGKVVLCFLGEWVPAAIQKISPLRLEIWLLQNGKKRNVMKGFSEVS